MFIRHYKITIFSIAMMITLSALGANTSKYVFVSVEGETLTSVFKRAGLSTSTLYKVLDADDKNVLARLKTGSEIEFFVDSDNTLKEMNVLHKGELISSFSRVLKNNEALYIYNNKNANKPTTQGDKANSIKYGNKENSAVSYFLVKNPKAKATLSDPHSVSKCLAGNIIAGALSTNKNEKNKIISLTTKIANLATTVQGGNYRVIINSLTYSYVDFYTYNESRLIEDLKINECANLNISVWNARFP